MSLPKTAPARRPGAARARRIATLAAAALGLTLALGACSLTARVTRPNKADSNQIYVWAGPLTYQVQLTRALNPYSTEDVNYLAGIKGAQSLPSNQLWFAVFLWCKNQTKRTHVTTSRFEIVDSSGHVYKPYPLNPALDPYAWTPQTLAPDGQEPDPDSTAAFGPSQGGEVLFRLNDSIYSNRPLTLRIFPPQGGRPTSISLDL